ncbi:MAG: GIY-YIG nuclease family protein [Candidatus Aureabacteria bacterium]|nr:GIY-YIG nuclease family protein [Candidatus Auribacterota bacterium]
MSPVRPWYYTYILQSKKNGQFYIGATSNLKKRLEEHTKGLVASTKYKRPLQLIYFEACLSKNDAFRRERYLKTGMGKRYLKNRLKRGLTG